MKLQTLQYSEQTSKTIKSVKRKYKKVKLSKVKEYFSRNYTLDFYRIFKENINTTPLASVSETRTENLNSTTQELQNSV